MASKQPEEDESEDDDVSYITDSEYSGESDCYIEESAKLDHRPNGTLSVATNSSKGSGSPRTQSTTAWSVTSQSSAPQGRFSVDLGSLIQEIDEDNADDIGDVKGSKGLTEDGKEDNNEEPVMVISHPPLCHSWGLPLRPITPPTPIPTPQPERPPEPRRKDQLVESKDWRDSRTMFGKVVEVTGVSSSQSIQNKENKEQLKNAAKVVDSVTSIPLSDFWHKFTRVFFALVFLANVIVEILDIVDSPSFLHYKLTALVFALVENVIILSAWAVFAFSKKYNSNKGAKHKQYIENIAHELLLYPLIVLSVLGFSTEKMYESPDGPLAWAQLVLLGIDLIDLLWTQAVRMYMLYQLTKDINKILNPEKDSNCCSYSIGGSILPRAYITVLGNTFIFLFLIFMLGAQMHQENLEQETYRMTWKSGLLTASLIVLPIFSMVLFLVANSYWLLEMFIKINLQISKSEDFQKQLEKDYGTSVSDAVNFAVDKGSKTQDRLNDIQSLSFTKKLFYSLTEFYGIVLLLIWEAIVIATVFSFDGFDELGFNTGTKIAFCVIAFLLNNHVALLALAMLIAALVFAIAFMFYPFSVILCFWKTFQGEDDETIIIRAS